ncbi:MAG: sulfatase-like hydrolase/transferase [Lentisphaerae bacterium]|nr:sulfatase-like hydrolase/transferase [Lentisphaerota bacterium]MBT4814676.1 sulfatase-like hydrolase/transferase [Lentisphaerota bacterium]MBT5609472.1 sulfatase-like hydrolase/transferase [Lentisphaerota bacterium]MBT7057717.1 sulfatase-like hydrolase/transferase [Lentisphaerota bacterium]MBT7848666.1 sulfatase-like hydrolase/transferase [Lentisphaerota bacterium]
MSERPNILIFMTDQQRGDSVLPSSQALMPNLDRFRAQGVTFSEAFCPSPHCCPSRATFLTGLYPSQHGVWNNVNVGNTLSQGLHDGVRLWSEDLSEAGYRMYFTGKWHVSNVESPQDRGWGGGHPTAGPRKPLPPGGSNPKPNPYEWAIYERIDRKVAPASRGEGEILRPGYGTYTHYGEKENPFNDQTVVNNALESIRGMEHSEQPWCQFVGTLGPHDPYCLPKQFLGMYNLEDIQLPPSFADRMQDKPGLYRRTRDRFDQLSEREHREAIRHYLAFCTYEDYLFGQVLDALDERGEADNTLVLFVSDHGDYMAEHGLWCKGLPCFRGAYHVPAIVRWPNGIAWPGRESDAFVSLADFAPTFLEMAGVTVAREFVGRSLTPFFRGEAPSDWRDAVFTQSNGNELYGIQRSVTTRDWKYVYNGFDYDELYDLRNDADEQRNLAEQADVDDTVLALSKRLWRFARETDDVCINPYIMVSLAPYGPGVALDS